jgi:hypothetical protein
LTTVNDDDRRAAARDAESADAALARADYQHGCLLLLRACAADPYDAGLRARFAEAVDEAEAFKALPDPLDGHQGFAVIAAAGFLLGDDSHLRSYAAALGDLPRAALVIDASDMDQAQAEQQLGALVERCGLADAQLTMIGIVGELHPAQRRRVDRAINAVYTSADTDPDPRDAATPVPVFTPDSLMALRELAERWDPEA